MPWLFQFFLTSLFLGSVKAQYRPIHITPPHMCSKISSSAEIGTPKVTFIAQPQPSVIAGKGAIYQCQVLRPFTHGPPTSIYILSPYGYKMCSPEEIKRANCLLKVVHIKPGEKTGMSFCVVSFGKQKTCILATAVDKQTATFPHVSVMSNKYAMKTAGRPFKAKCQAIGFPRPTVRWLKGPAEVDDDSDHHVINTDNESTELVIDSLGIQHQGTYECYASNVLGTAYSNKISIQLNPAPPMFSEQPINRTVLMGKKAVATCTAIGYPQPSIAWLKDDYEMLEPDNSSVKSSIKGSRVTSYLTIANVTQDRLGKYRCIASNFRGKVASDDSYIICGEPAVIKPTEKKKLYLDLVIGLAASGLLLAAAGFWVFKVFL